MSEAADDIVASQYAYWGALLTFNGIVISIFSEAAINGQQSQWLIFILILLSLTTSVLLIINFLVQGSTGTILRRNSFKLSRLKSKKQPNI